MKLLKGLNRDIQPQNIPESNYVEAKNIVVDDIGSITNEEGFDLFDSSLENSSIIGVVRHSDGESVIFSISPSNESEIGVLTSNGYERVCKDSIINPLFNFNIEYPITGELERNILGELVVVWTDTNGDESLNTPKILNLNNLPFEVDPITKEILEPNKFNQVNLFPDIKIPNIILNEVSDIGGNLITGTYYISISYKLSDGSYTNYTLLSNPIYINEDSKGAFTDYDGAESGTTTTKSIDLTFENLDINFEGIRVGVIKVIGGITSASYVNIEIPIDSTSVNYIYRGTASETSISPDEILINPVSYTGIHTITQLNRRLYIGNLTTFNTIDYQKYANNITIEWVSKDVGMDSLVDSYKNEVVSYFDKSFLAGEVYALFIYFVRKDGTIVDSFHIPGREALTTELDIVSDSDLTRIDASAREFEFKDFSQSDGTMSYWENLTERYPNIEEFDSTSLGGEDLRAKPVRHHKFPNIKALTSYGLTGNDGKSELPPVGNITNMGWEGPNIPNLSPSTAGHHNLDIIFNGVSIDTTLFTTSGSTHILELTSANDQIVNFSFRLSATVFMELNRSGILDSFIESAEHLFRIYISRVDGSVEILYIDERDLDVDITPAVFPVGSSNYTVNEPLSYLLDFGLNLRVGDKVVIEGRTRINIGNNNNPYSDPTGDSFIVGTLNLTPTFVFPNSSSNDPSKFTQPILGFKASNIVIPQEIKDQVQGFGFAYASRDFENVTNIGQSLLFPSEFLDTFSGKEGMTTFRTDETTRFHSFDLLNSKVNPNPSYIEVESIYNRLTNTYSPVPLSLGNAILKVDDTVESTYKPDNNSAANNEFREEHISTVLDLENDIVDLDGIPIVNYKLLTKDLYVPFISSSLVRCSNIIDINTTTTDDIYNGDTYRELYGFRLMAKSGSGGYVGLPELNISTLISCFSRSHIGFRHEGDERFEKYFPKSTLPSAFGPPEEDYFDASDYIGYNSDYSLLNDLWSAIPENYIDKPSRFPYRVARSIVLAKEDIDLKWRTFLALDYYEMPRNRGVVWNVQGFREQNLIIHCTEMLYITYGNEVLKQDTLDITLGTGDIFARPPRELLSEDNGYAGTTSQFSATITKIGYIFVDEKRGKIFLLRVNNKFQLEEISAIGLRNWFRDNLALKNNINKDDNPFNNRGYTITTDELKNRIIFTKKDITDEDRSFTLSYNINNNVWIGFHSYKPNYLLSLNNNPICINNNKFYKFNSNNSRGLYFPDEITIPDSSYIDVVFTNNPNSDNLFYSLSWISDLYNSNNKALFNETISSIWIYNDYQSSVEIDIQRLNNSRRTGGKWSFNSFLDVLTEESRNSGNSFLIETIEGVDLDLNSVTENQSWHKKKRFIHNHIIVRFKFNNLDNRKLILHEVFSNSRSSGR